MQRLWIAIITVMTITLVACSQTSPTKIGDGMPVALVTSDSTARPQTDLTATELVRESSKTPEPTATITPTLDLSRFANVWEKYQNEAYGISFDYPAVYNESPYTDYACGIRLSEPADSNEVYFYLGERITLAIIEAKNETLTDYVDHFVEKNEGDDFTLISRSEGQVGGVKAITLEYRFGAFNRYGTVTYFKRSDKLYAVDFTAGVFCEMMTQDTTSGMSEFGAYFHILESFQFINGAG